VKEACGGEDEDEDGRNQTRHSPGKIEPLRAREPARIPAFAGRSGTDDSNQCACVSVCVCIYIYIYIYVYVYIYV